MKKLTIVLGLLLITGGAFAQKACCKKGGEHGGKACCKKEAGKHEEKEGEEHHDMSMAGGHKACCKKDAGHGAKACCKKHNEAAVMEKQMIERKSAPMERVQEAPAQR